MRRPRKQGRRESEHDYRVARDKRNTPMLQTADVLTRLRPLPFGLKVFSRLIALKAPYFATIKPELIELSPGKGVAKLRKRRAVQNHIGTVHAIAMANLCEFIGGVTLEVSLPRTHRWLPKGMNIQYLKKAETNLTATTTFPLGPWPDAGTFNVHVDVHDERGALVVTADIPMHVSLKKA
jgi:acyl-coenzyme A thioesterase PaaI-like protein